MSCPICGGSMVGDGHTTLMHCEFARDEDIEGKEADAGPVYCVAIVKVPCTHPLPGDSYSSVCGLYWGKCRKCGEPIVRVMGFKRWRHQKGAKGGSL